MTEHVTVPVVILERAAGVLFRHLAEQGITSVSVPGDHYWSVPPATMFEVYAESPELTIGQLSECLDQLERMVADPEETTSYALVWLADLLRVVGSSVVG